MAGSFPEVRRLRAVVVSDTHLSPRAPEADANWDAVVDHVDHTLPDLVLHVGDLTLDGMSDASELHRARGMLDRLSVPWHAVPGNHDVGDNPVAGHVNGATITAGRQRSWLATIGADRWAIDRAGWRLIGLNAQLFGSGLAAEAAQWAWLSDQLERMPAGCPMVLIMHKPLSAPEHGLGDAPPYRFVPHPARNRLERLLDGRDAPLVISGHVHQFRVLDTGARRHVWAPSSWAVLPDGMQTPYGAKRCGIVSLTLTADGQTHASLVEPADLSQITLTQDIPDPYDR